MDTIDSFMKPILDFINKVDAEIIIVDNLSIDGTADRILSFQKILGNRLVFKQVSCNRGKGRRLAINLARGEYILNLDADICYEGLTAMLHVAEENENENIVIFRGSFYGATATFGPTDFFQNVANYPPLNYAEDLYVWKVAENLGRLRVIDSNDKWMIPIEREISHKLKNGEKRYSQNRLELWKRRIENVSDILFVEHCNFAFYRKNFTDGRLQTLPYAILLYSIGSVFTKKIKLESPDELIKRMSTTNP